jgi:hypothetical protein
LEDLENRDTPSLEGVFNRCIEKTGSIESAIAFAGIIAKAKIARMKRRR